MNGGLSLIGNATAQRILRSRSRYDSLRLLPNRKREARNFFYFFVSGLLAAGGPPLRVYFNVIIGLSEF